MPSAPFTDVGEFLASADQFAVAHPAIAGALGTRCADASVERVREGIAYLAACVMDRVGELEVDGQRAIADAVAPDLLRPVPAATIVELSTEGAARRVPAGAEVCTVGPRSCRFRTVGEVRPGPWRVEQARLERKEGQPDALSFDLVATCGPALGEAMGNRARFFVDAGRESALQVVAHVLSHTARADLRVEGAGGSSTLGAVHAYGTRPEHALLPEADAPPTGMALLREYFLLPEKFCFFEIAGFAAALRAAPSVRRATVRLRFDAPLPGRLAITAGAIRAHCVPAVNLFEATAEPWRFEPGRSSAPLRVAGLPPGHASVYDVSRVWASPADAPTADPVLLFPARRFAAEPPPAAFPYAYSTPWVAQGLGDDPSLVLTLTSPRGRAPVLIPHVVSAGLLATNGSRAIAVRPGELTVPGAGMPPGVRAHNVVAGSPYAPPPVGAELALRIAVHAAIPDGDPLFALRSRLLAVVPQGGADAALARACERRVDAIESLEVVVAADRGTPRRGYEARLSLDETAFQGLGDVALFVRLLQVALEAQTSAGHWVRVVAVCRKGGARVVWPSERP